MSTTIDNAFYFQHVSYVTEHQTILNNITGTITKGKITALVGPSGAGKTTLLKLCNGLLSPTKGTIFVNGQPIEAIPPTTLRRQVGMVLQNSPMIKGTVYDNVALPLRLQGKTLSLEEAAQLLENVGLETTFLERDASDLSGGQRQKVSIARTLTNNSGTLLLDEITSALDQASVNEVEQLIRTISETRQTTIIWITHHLEQALRMAQEVWVMMGGELIESGTIDLLHTSTNPFVQRFVAGVKQ